MSSVAFNEEYFTPAPGCERWDSGLHKALDHSKKPLVHTSGWDSGLHKVVQTERRELHPEHWDKTVPVERRSVTREGAWTEKVFPRPRWPVHEDGWDSGLHKTIPNEPPLAGPRSGGWDSGLHKVIPNEQHEKPTRTLDKSLPKENPSLSRRPVRRDAWLLADRKTIPNTPVKDPSVAPHGKRFAVSGTGWDSGLFKVVPNATETTAARLRASRETHDNWESGDKVLHDPRATYRVRSTGAPLHNYEPSKAGIIHEQPRGRRFLYSAQHHQSQIVF
eukprot:TRINITY_DN14542_c0_g1_i1.p1 TRINITY_DN14542_c0_g1~~TRINITY_DN14542_c0_g1_i1.p1  ORF type:complete len:276 (-),score=48.04 TRINITY_DN14542_c0_g1_i1:152-979(-)